MPSTSVASPARHITAYRLDVREGRPRSWWRRHRLPLVSVAAVLPLYVVWAVFLATGGGDLAAQDAWAQFTAGHPGAAYNLAWYGGTHVANYSVLSPYLMGLCGVRAATVAAGLGATWGSAALFARTATSRPLWPALLAALALWCNVASGRTTFALGTAFGVAACLLVTGGARRIAGAAVCGVLATLASPVAGLFLLVAGAGLLLTREVRRAAALLAPPVVVVGVTTVLFPFSGEQPMAFGRIWPPFLLAAVVAVCAPRRWRALRRGAVVYAAGVVAAYCVTSPIGDNVERLAGLFAPALLLACLLAPGRRRAQVVALGVALTLSVVWLAEKTVDDLTISTTVPAWAAHTDGVTAELRHLGADKSRVEVVPARDHREATLFARHFTLARGWNRQLDMDRNPLFYGGTLSPADYRAWLHDQAVGYVVLHNGRLDDHAVLEGALLDTAPAGLEPVWSDANWRIFRVSDATPVVSGGGSVVRSSPADLVVRVPAPGAVTLRVVYSPWLRVGGGGCLAKSGAWTRLTVPRAGTYDIGSGYRLPRQTACPAGS